jgi:hypothetical protein
MFILKLFRFLKLYKIGLYPHKTDSEKWDLPFYSAVGLLFLCLFNGEQSTFHANVKKFVAYIKWKLTLCLRSRVFISEDYLNNKTDRVQA